MEPVAGSLLAPLLLAGAAFSNHLTDSYGATANYWAIGLHISCWIAQFVGHGIFEGRAPALLDNLVQAFFLAPFFVWMEILFLFGYRPGLQSRIAKAVEKEVDKFHQSKLHGNGRATNGKIIRTIASLALSLAVYKYAHGDPDKQPLLTRWLHYYDSMQEDFKRKTYMNIKFVEEAGKDRHLFETAPFVGHMELKFPE
ncbi:uncharacterized protein KY384_004171 [Bacidia gigantensis]|uniref:uncharacterized protein n=1 Tax=Bacidia gigantensis TaxID=2732470 RepID=UPI001D04B29C|nr:uncharacterized protein KY384_004171 [Bacidia gigantensis]KAG8530814.1 hypothetical protein KY384_004171 [Bacidia gigantensis]